VVVAVAQAQTVAQERAVLEVAAMVLQLGQQPLALQTQAVVEVVQEVELLVLVGLGLSS
jgi:hypothetical protein